MKKILKGFIFIAFNFTISCSSNHKGEDRKEPAPNQGGGNIPPTSKNGDGGLGPASWYGMTAKCLIEVVEKKEESQTYLEQKVACSEIMPGNSQADVSAKLDVWSKLNCPKLLEIRLITTEVGAIRRNWGGKHFTAFGPENVVSNSREGLDEKLASKQFCQGGRYFNYGYVSP